MTRGPGSTPVIDRICGSSSGPALSKARYSAPRVDAALTKTVTPAKASGGWSAIRSSRPRTKASAKSTPGGSA